MKMREETPNQRRKGKKVAGSAIGQDSSTELVSWNSPLEQKKKCTSEEDEKRKKDTECQRMKKEEKEKQKRKQKRKEKKRSR